MLAGWLGFELAGKLFGVPRVFPAAMAIVRRVVSAASRVRFTISLIERNST